MQRLLHLFIYAVLCSAPATAATAPTDARFELLDRIAAVVNDGLVLQSDLDNEVGNVIRQMREQNRALPDADTLRRQVMERLVVRTVQLQRARSSGLQIDDATLNRTLEDLARNNKMNLAQFRQALIRQGYDYRRFREDIRDELLVAQVRRRELNSRINVSDQEIDDQLAELERDQNQQLERHLRQIFLAVPEGSTPDRIEQVKQRAQEVFERLRDGAEFTALAARTSEDERALEGGDLGWRTNAQLPGLFAAAVSELTAGESTPPIRSPIGFHILQLVETRGEQRYIVSQTLARHILLRITPVRSDEQARTALLDLLRRIRNGEDFATIAGTHSDDSASASQGGELPWFSAGAMAPEFDEAVAGLPPGTVSEPFRTQFGWHLVEVLDRRDEDNTSEFQKSKARRLIRQRKLEIETETWLRRLRDEAYVELRLDAESQ